MVGGGLLIYNMTNLGKGGEHKKCTAGEFGMYMLMIFNDILKF